MKLVVASALTQGDLPNDYDFCVPGELVMTHEPCATDRADPDGRCGCGRGFAGLSSLRATTTAEVQELALSLSEVRAAVAGYLDLAGWLGRVSALAWIVAGALAAVAALFLVGAPTPGVSAAAYTVALRAFPAAILGGLDSTGGALVGGLLIGITESLASGYQDQLLFLGRGFGDVVPYVVMIIVLLVRPSGLFGNPAAAK